MHAHPSMHVTHLTSDEIVILYMHSIRTLWDWSELCITIVIQYVTDTIEENQGPHQNVLTIRVASWLMSNGRAIFSVITLPIIMAKL